MPHPFLQNSFDVRDLLQEEPYQFDFFQAIRMLRWLAATSVSGDAAERRKPVGQDYDPAEEVVRLRSVPSHQFPQGPVTGFKAHGATENSPPELTVGFFGLTGPQGVLPRHYTQLVIDRMREKDTALRDFLDIFHHRLLSQFYRAWSKYRLPIAYEESFLEGVALGEDRVSRCMYCLVGMGTSGLRGRHQFADPALLYYAGHFAHRPRNVSSLQRMLADYFQLPVTVQQFRGQWLYLAAEDQSRPGIAPLGHSYNNQLGHGVVVGRRVWSIENKFRVRLGPLTYEQFLRFTPARPGLKKLAQFIRMYVGPEFDFDVQLVLHRDEIPPCQARGGDQETVRLGWNTWVRSGPDQRHVDDGVFVAEGEPDDRNNVTAPAGVAAASRL